MWEWEASFFSPGEQRRLPATWLMQTSIYSLLLLLSEAAQRTHMERREKKRREQSAKVHSHHTRTPHTHHVWSQWAKEVYWSFQQEEVEWKQEKNNSEVMKQGHRFNCIDVFCGDRNISVPLLSGSSDIWPLYSCWRVKISEILRPRGFILCAHAESLKNMTWLLPALSSPCSPDSSQAAGRRHVWSFPSFHSPPSTSLHPHPQQLEREYYCTLYIYNINVIFAHQELFCCDISSEALLI